jgi:hypothetical protein
MVKKTSQRNKAVRTGARLVNRKLVFHPDKPNTEFHHASAAAGMKMCENNEDAVA